jgi:hypothetical protein
MHQHVHGELIRTTTKGQQRESAEEKNIPLSGSRSNRPLFFFVLCLLGQEREMMIIIRLMANQVKTEQLFKK